MSSERSAEPGLDQQSVITSVWDGHDDENYRRDQSHWRGHGRWTEEQWLQLGRALLVRVRDLYRTTGARPNQDGIGTVLEWGPGGGANLYALAPLASQLYGVDISEKNLEESARQLAEFRDTPYRPILLTGEPAQVADAVTEPLDLFFSSTVFQHFPSQEYGLEVLRVAFDLMRPGARGYVQIRYDDGTPKYAPKSVEQYSQSHLYATSYSISDFWDALQNVGFRPIKISNLNTKVNYAAFYFVKPA